MSAMAPVTLAVFLVGLGLILVAAVFVAGPLFGGESADRVRAEVPDERWERQKRQALVAGIRAFYDAATLVGRQVIVVANLEPANLRGVESQGMVLATTDPATNRTVLLRPDDAVTAGAVVR